MGDVFEDFNILAVLASVPMTVALVILLVNRAKTWLATTPLAAVPIWVIACVLSSLAVAGSYYGGVLQLEEGQTLFLLIQRAVVLAAAASGFREWWAAGLLTPMSASSDSRAAVEKQG